MDYIISYRHRVLGCAEIRCTKSELDVYRRVIADRGMNIINVRAL